MFALTCFAPSVSIKFAKITLAAFATMLASSLLRSLFTGKSPIPEINDLRRAEDVFAKSVSGKEYRAFQVSKNGIFKKAEPQPLVAVDVKVKTTPSLS